MRRQRPEADRGALVGFDDNRSKGRTAGYRGPFRSRESQELPTSGKSYVSAMLASYLMEFVFYCNFVVLCDLSCESGGEESCQKGARTGMYRFGNGTKGYNGQFPGSSVVAGCASSVETAEPLLRGSSPPGSGDILGCKRSPSFVGKTCYGV
jgi:hypothetical protein